MPVCTSLDKLISCQNTRHLELAGAGLKLVPLVLPLAGQNKHASCEFVSRYSYICCKKSPTHQEVVSWGEGLCGGAQILRPFGRFKSQMCCREKGGPGRQWGPQQRTRKDKAALCGNCRTFFCWAGDCVQGIAVVPYNSLLCNNSC